MSARLYLGFGTHATSTLRASRRRFGASAKFWQVSTTAATLTVTFGKIGTDGRTLKKELESPAKAMAAAAALVHEKIGKGYVEIVGKETAATKTIGSAVRDPVGAAGAVIDALYSQGSSGPQRPTGRFIHWWGQFSAELPAAFRLRDGGHGWIEAEDRDHAAELLERLRTGIGARWPLVKEWAGEGWYRWMIPDGRQLTAQFRTKAGALNRPGDNELRVVRRGARQRGQ